LSVDLSADIWSIKKFDYTKTIQHIKVII